MKFFDINDFVTHKKELDKDKNHNLVMTNGCFDVLHIGHIKILEESKKLGGSLLVAVNSDESVARLKGSNRPINNSKDRIRLLSAIEFIDFIILFEEDTPKDIIKAISPDFLVKGADYGAKDIVGADHVKSYGGQVITIDLVEGYSSSKIISSLKSNETKL